MATLTEQHTFSIPDTRLIIKDLFDHRPLVYWIDFLVSLSIGYAAAIIYLFAPLFSALQIGCLFIAAVALFRVGSFIHEIVHMSGRTMLPFRIGWNILAGIPMLMPSHFYGNHIDHHSSRHYGTAQDGEYLPLGTGLWSEILGYFLQMLFVPIAIFLRFLVLTPISFLNPRLREWTLEYASSFGQNLRYRRRLTPGTPRRWWAVVDVLCCLRAWLLIIPLALDLLPLVHVPLLYVLSVFALGLNYVRNLVAHRFRSVGRPMSHEEQLADSITIEGGPILTELFFPLGLRYHALHHLFATLPYHNLGIAHQRLMAQLPADSTYRETVYPSYWDAVGAIVRNRRRHPTANRRRAQAWRARRRRRLEAAASGERMKHPRAHSAAGRSIAPDSHQKSFRANCQSTWPTPPA